MKNKKVLSSLYFCLSIVWFGLAVPYLSSSERQGRGIVFLAIGMMWISLGLTYLAKERKGSKTIRFYNENATQFVGTTANADMSEARERFLSHIPEGGRILDWGCGSGRDTLAFLQKGYQVDAVDASYEMCKLASEATGIEVQCEYFENLEPGHRYDGIWACASLLHVELEALPETLETARHALKAGGVFYLSFKYGDFQGERRGRFFTDMNEKRFEKVIRQVKRLEVKEQWISEDVRPERENEKWFNVLLEKQVTK